MRSGGSNTYWGLWGTLQTIIKRLLSLLNLGRIFILRVNWIVGNLNFLSKIAVLINQVVICDPRRYINIRHESGIWFISRNLSGRGRYCILILLGVIIGTAKRLGMLMCSLAKSCNRWELWLWQIIHRLWWLRIYLVGNRSMNSSEYFFGGLLRRIYFL